MVDFQSHLATGIESPAQIQSSARWLETSQKGLQPDSQAENHRRMSIDALPDEIWMLVFQEFDSSSDLLKVVQTCKLFYSLAIEALHRDVYWKGPFSYTQNLPLWRRHGPSINLAPTSLTITISAIDPSVLPRRGVFVVEEDGTYASTPASVSAQSIHEEEEGPHNLSSTLVSALPSKLVSFFASDTMYSGIMLQISTFTRLRDLVFHCCDVPETVFPTIQHLLGLRHLSFQFCALPAMNLPPDLSFSQLPITELTLWAIEGDSYQVPNSNYVYIMYLCTARNLRKLSIDWCPTTGRFLGNSLPGGGAGIAPLTRLTELKLRFPLSPEWRGQGPGASGQVLERFLQGCPNIVRFASVDRRLNFTFPDTLLPNVKSYSGTMASGLPLLQTRPTIDSIEITDGGKLDELVEKLEEMATCSTQLKSLSFRTQKWDIEIMHVLVAHYQGLRDLSIAYDSGFISEQTLIGLGALFLCQFPRLESLEIYRATVSGTHPTDICGVVYKQELQHKREELFGLKVVTRAVYPDNQPVDDDSYVMESLSAWRKPCPLLRQVKLKEDSVWRRTYDGNGWHKIELPAHSTAKFAAMIAYDIDF